MVKNNPDGHFNESSTMLYGEGHSDNFTNIPVSSP